MFCPGKHIAIPEPPSQSQKPKYAHLLLPLSECGHPVVNMVHYLATLTWAEETQCKYEGNPPAWPQGFAIATPAHKRVALDLNPLWRCPYSWEYRVESTCKPLPISQSRATIRDPEEAPCTSKLAVQKQGKIVWNHPKSHPEPSRPRWIMPTSPNNFSKLVQVLKTSWIT